MNTKTTLKRIFLSSVLILGSIISNAQTWGIITNLQITPVNPTSMDTIKVIASTQFAHSYCFLISSNISINDTIINVSVTHMEGGWTAICNSVDTLTLGYNFEQGNYTVIYTLFDTAGGIYDVDTIAFSILSTSMVHYYSDFNLEVYPNPVNDFVTFKIKHLNKSSLTLKVFNTLGKEVFRKNFENEKLIFEREGIPSGIYMYNIDIDKEILYRGKLILE